ncbi:cutinase family protein [Nocardia noduli]|uniref:cutinase family protein n=1 Tax=Nocardia noduli TaxID=2815722 RepID=UPI001C234B73|nr:cutinase family protein [Nocardia noduli]
MKSAPWPVTRSARAFVLAVTVTIGVGYPATAAGDDGVATVSGPDCPGFFVLGVQGTGQSSPDSPVAVDSGLLATVLAPLARLGDGRVAGRAYVPYSAGFGGAFPGTSATYSDSANEGLRQLRVMAESVVDRCPRSQLGLIGYSQGAHVVSMFASEVGRGASAVPADRVAAVALLADPTRAPGAAILPGLPDGGHPEPAPGTTGAELNTLPAFSQRSVAGGGIGPVRDIAQDFGGLTGRVASLCLPGDLACDAPPGAPLLHMIVDILGQAELLPSDPVAALTSISDALAGTVARAATAVVNHDLRGYSLGTLSLTPEAPLSVRLAEAADPRADDDAQARQALLKLGTSALNTLVAIIGVAFTPSEVADIATAPDPLTGLERATTALVAAARRPLPRRTAFNLIAKTFNALGHLSVDNAELLDPLTWLRYTDTVRRHGEYSIASYAADGQSATGLVLDWFTAVAEDLAVNRVPETSPSETPSPTVVSPTAVSSAPAIASASGVSPPPVAETVIAADPRLRSSFVTAPTRTTTTISLLGLLLVLSVAALVTRRIRVGTSPNRQGISRRPDAREREG